MKNLLILATMLLTFGFANAQKIYSVDYENQADVKVFVVQYENQADLKVYKVKYENQAAVVMMVSGFLQNIQIKQKRKSILLNMKIRPI